MKQSASIRSFLPLLFLAIPWVYLAFIWNDLPPTIPTHFGISGKPDAFGKRNEIFLAPVIMTVTGTFLYFLLKNIYKIDPKKKYAAGTSETLSKIALLVLVLLSGVTVFILYWTVKGKVEGFSVFFCLFGLFFAYLGNLMHSVKPNYFVGFRIPWALENEENWRKTHQLASKVWFAGGLLLAVASLIFKAEILVAIFISLLFLMTIIPVVYSYWIYRQSGKNG